MRRTKILVWSIVSVLLLALLLTLFLFPGGVLPTSLFGHFYRYGNAEEYVTGTDTFAAEAVTALDIDWIEGAVILRPSEDRTFSIEESAAVSLENENDQMHTRLSDGTLSIKYAASGKLRLGMRKTLIVRVPFTVRLSWLKVSTTSASLELTSLACEKMDLSTTSGSMKIGDSNGVDLTAGSTSGRVTLTGSTFGDIEINTTSGDMVLDDVGTGTLLIDSTSGSLRFAGRATAIRANTTSGSVHLTPETDELSEINVDSTSGDVTVLLPEGTGFSASLDSVSGDFRGNFDARRSGSVYLCGDGKIRITVNTVSGDLRLEKK